MRADIRRRGKGVGSRFVRLGPCFDAKRLPTPFPRWLVALAATAALCAGGELRGQAPQARLTAITRGTLVDVRTGRPVPDAVVLIEGDRVKAAGPASSVQVPSGARIVDARGKWLIPGLFDMHCHVGGGSDLPLELFIANGVTTVRDTGGIVSIQRLMRDAIAAGKRVGPRLYFAGAVLDGNPPVFPTNFIVDTPARAASAVDFLVDQGVDFIKVYNNLTEPVLQTILERARARNTLVVGHVPRVMTMTHAVELGLDHLEHIRITGRELLPKEEADKIDFLPLSRRETLLWDRYDLSSPKMKALIDFLAQRKVFLDPTFTVDEAFFVESVYQAQRSHPNNRYLPRRTLEQWSQPPPDLFRVPPELREMSAAGFPKRLQFIGLCARAGVRIIAGTDGAGLGIMMPGFGLHHELSLLARAGLSPMEILRAATLTAAEALGHEKELGTIEAGKFADVVVLTADPLADIANAQKIDVVVKGGEVYSPRTLLDGLIGK
jgi:imidazolonepropionase-like amidohydrolase